MRKTISLLLIFFFPQTNLLAKEEPFLFHHAKTKTVITPEMLNGIKDEYKDLKSSFFYSHKIRFRNPKVGRERIKEYANKINQKENPVKLIETKIETDDGIELECLHLKRTHKENKKCIVLAHGFASVKEHMALFIDIFDKDHDLFLIGLRGHSIPAFYDIRPLKNLFYVDLNTTIGDKEHLDIFAAVDHLNENFGYSKLIGFGSCYGAFLIAKAQAIRRAQNHKHLFNKIILYSLWPSVYEFIKRYVHDPKLIFDNKNGGWENCCSFKNEFVINSIDYLIKNLFEINLTELTLLSNKNDFFKPGLKNIQVPILLIHSTDDKVVTNKDFDQCWNEIINNKKFALVTSHKHNRVHIEEPELFACVCNDFIDDETQK